MNTPLSQQDLHQMKRYANTGTLEVKYVQSKRHPNFHYIILKYDDWSRGELRPAGSSSGKKMQAIKAAKKIAQYIEDNFEWEDIDIEQDYNAESVRIFVVTDDFIRKQSEVKESTVKKSQMLKKLITQEVRKALDESALPDAITSGEVRSAFYAISDSVEGLRQVIVKDKQLSQDPELKKILRNLSAEKDLLWARLTDQYKSWD